MLQFCVDARMFDWIGSRLYRSMQGNVCANYLALLLNFRLVVQTLVLDGVCFDTSCIM